MSFKVISYEVVLVAGPADGTTLDFPAGSMHDWPEEIALPLDDGSGTAMYEPTAGSMRAGKFRRLHRVYRYTVTVPTPAEAL